MSFCLRPNVCKKCGKPLTMFEGWVCLECEKLEQEPTVDVLEKIRTEIYQLHCHPKLDFIKTDEVVDMALDIIDKYK